MHKALTISKFTEDSGSIDHVSEPHCGHNRGIQHL